MKTFIITLTAAALFFSFAKPKNQKPPKSEFNLGYIEKNLVYIPAGSLLIGAKDETPSADGKVDGHFITMDGFYMFNQEVCNGLYRFYMEEMRSKGDTAVYRAVLPDTAIWNLRGTYMEPYTKYYLRHPAYSSYPVVGVTHRQCEQFCQWLTDVYNSNPKRKHKKVVFELPSENQWEYAARGTDQFGFFPWKGYSMRNAKGQYLANFRQFSEAGIMRMEFETTTPNGGKKMDTYYVAAGGGDYMGVAGSLNDAADVTAPVKSYWPNYFGLYNMAGNVEEFVKEEGKTRGGSWRDPGYYLRNNVFETHDSSHSASAERGFRFIMKVIEE